VNFERFNGPMRKLYGMLLAALLAGAILLSLRSELNATSEAVTQCGFWGDIEDGMSCR